MALTIPTWVLSTPLALGQQSPGQSILLELCCRRAGLQLSPAPAWPWTADPDLNRSNGFPAWSQLHFVILSLRGWLAPTLHDRPLEMAPAFGQDDRQPYHKGTVGEGASSSR